MLFHRLTYGTVYSCVDISTNNTYSLLSLKKTMKELTIVHREMYESFDSLTSGLKGCKHVFLIINNEQVLTKNVDITHIAKESVVKGAFPNINLKDFYYDVLDTETSSLVSICRKEVVQNILDDFEAKEISIVQFSLGNTTFQKLLPFLNDFSFHTSNGIFEINDHKIIGWRKEKSVSKTYDINGLKVKPKEVLPLSGVLSYFDGVKKSEDDIQISLLSNFKQKRTFQLGIRVGLGFLLVSLLINFFVFSSYQKSVSTLKEDLSVGTVYKKQLLKLDEIVGKKKQLVESMKAASNSKVIWYVDQLAHSVPSTVSLKKMNYQPLSRTIRKDKVVIFSSNQMVISGEAKDDNDLTKWLSDLENKQWINKVTVNLGGENVKTTSFDLLVDLNLDSQ